MTVTLDAPTRAALRREIDYRRRVRCRLIVPASPSESPMDTALIALFEKEVDVWWTAVELASATGVPTRKVGASLRKLHGQQRLEVVFRSKSSPSRWRLRRS